MVTEIQKGKRGSKTHDFRLLPSLKIQEWNRVMVTIFSYLCGCFFNATCESGLKILMLDGSQTQVWLLFFTRVFRRSSYYPPASAVPSFPPRPSGGP